MLVPNCSTNFREPLFCLSPEENTGEDVVQRLGAVARAAAADTRDSTHPLGTVATGVGVVSLQIFDRSRASLAFIPASIVGTYEHTHSPMAAAVVGGAMVAGYCATIGATLTETFRRFPKAVKTAEEKFPAVSDFLGEALPGNVSREAGESRLGVRRLGRQALRSFRRGSFVTLQGTDAYVANAALNGEDTPAIHRLNLTASTEAGIVVGAASFGVTETAKLLGDRYQLINNAVEFLGHHSYVWLLASSILVASEYLPKQIKKYRTTDETANA